MPTRQAAGAAHARIRFHHQHAGAEVRRCTYTNYCEGLDQRHKQVTCQLWDRVLDEPEDLEARAIPGLADYDQVRPEVRYGENSRIDFLLSELGLSDVYVEVKNVHLRRNGDLAEFPDCVTARGAKHLGELSAMVAEGHRAVMLYLVQRSDCVRFALARDLDPGYAQAFDRARTAGVDPTARALSTLERRSCRQLAIREPRRPSGVALLSRAVAVRFD